MVDAPGNSIEQHFYFILSILLVRRSQRRTLKGALKEYLLLRITIINSDRLLTCRTEEGTALID